MCVCVCVCACARYEDGKGVRDKTSQKLYFLKVGGEREKKKRKKKNTNSENFSI